MTSKHEKYARVGLLTLIGASDKRTASNKILYRWRCDCGNEILRDLSAVAKSEREGSISHCNKDCTLRERRTVHGLSHQRPYVVWKNMISRTCNPNNPDWNNYGGRGISTCAEWRTFKSFWKDMHGTYAPHLTIERIDNNGNYCKENCEWATTKKQALNRRNNTVINTSKGPMVLSEAVKLAGLNYMTVYTRLRSGVPEENLLDPVGAVKYKTNQ